MSPLDGKKAYKAMRKKGFKESDNKSPDHKWVDFWFEGKLTKIKTKFSHNDQEIDNYLITAMSRQINLSRKEFVEFAKCNLSEEGYIKILKDKGIKLS
ncbi:hypothetical protein [Reichenbachiella agariperforans]|uniref:hypothetical protein n=1 Tax=Reichenbachiella agariperforans TaxID=156994 RepID=UPI001C0943F8|nr:hypothetical protein [Reichenbachiella agariperforans]MBU2912713.1 hypothetical protein [Reichenbachiella agariperforans]